MKRRRNTRTKKYNDQHMKTRKRSMASTGKTEQEKKQEKGLMEK